MAAAEKSVSYGRGVFTSVCHGIEAAVQNDSLQKPPSGTIVMTGQSITTMTPTMAAFEIPSAGRNTFLALLRRFETCSIPINFAAISTVLDGFNKVNGHFTPASIQALMYHMRSCLRSVESSIIHNKDQWLIMLTLGCVDLIDRQPSIISDLRGGKLC